MEGRPLDLGANASASFCRFAANARDSEASYREKPAAGDIPKDLVIAKSQTQHVEREYRRISV
jgi:hypothetical protein